MKLRPEQAPANKAFAVNHGFPFKGDPYAHWVIRHFYTSNKKLQAEILQQVFYQQYTKVKLISDSTPHLSTLASPPANPIREDGIGLFAVPPCSRPSRQVAAHFIRHQHRLSHY
jgi:hypothetical protein